MKLRLIINEINNNSFYVSCNNQCAVLNEIDNSYTFHFKESGEYKICIKQNKSQPLKLWRKLGYCIISLIQAIFYILVFNDEINWIDKVTPYCIECNIKINIESCEELVLSFKRNGLMPTVEFQNNNPKLNMAYDVVYFENKYDYNLKFFHYFRKITAIYIYIYILFGYIAVSAFKTNNYSLCIFSIFSVLVFLILNIRVYLKNKKPIPN